MSKKDRPHTPKKHRWSRSRNTDRIDDGFGPPCPRCSRITQRWRWPDYVAHAAMTGKPAYKWWYQCMDPTCPTKQIMPPEAIYDPRRPGSDEHQANLAYFRGI
jgi:hypothetical protein